MVHGGGMVVAWPAEVGLARHYGAALGMQDGLVPPVVHQHRGAHTAVAAPGEEILVVADQAARGESSVRCKSERQIGRLWEGGGGGVRPALAGKAHKKVERPHGTRTATEGGLPRASCQSRRRSARVRARVEAGAARVELRRYDGRVRRQQAVLCRRQRAQAQAHHHRH